MAETGKHTPGPWHFGHLGSHALWIGPNHTQTPVAHVDHDTRRARQNSRENARLIAAAPDMLNALKKSAEGWANAIELGIIAKQHVAAAEILRDEALAIIAKAEGRAALAKAEGR